MATLADLIVPEPASAVEDKTLSLLGAAGLPVTSWEAGSFPRTLVSIFSTVTADLWFGVASIANGVILDLSRGAWLSLFGKSQYQEARKDPVLTEGEVVLTNSSLSPYTITAGAFTVATSSGLRYSATSGGSLAPGGSLTITVRAEKAASSANVAVGAINTLVTSLPGVTVDNPAIGTTGTWITVLGADRESDSTYRERMRAKWGALSTGSPKSAYKYWALSQVGVTRSSVDDMNPDGPGSTRVYIDSALAVTPLQTFLDTKIPAGSKVTAVAATSQTVAVPATARVKRAYRTQAEAGVSAALATLASEIDIGGIVYEAEIIERCMAAGLIDFQIGGAWTGTPNVQLGSDKIPTFSPSISWIEE